MNKPLFVFLASTILGCSGSDASDLSAGGGSGGSAAGDALYASTPGSSVTPGELFGVWAGSVARGGLTFDNRMKFTETSVTSATRCTFPDGTKSPTAAVTATARVSETEIAVLETVSDEQNVNGNLCRVELRAMELPRCVDQPPFARSCFAVQGTKLALYGSSPLEDLDFTKVSD